METDKQEDGRRAPDRGNSRSNGPEVGGGVDNRGACHRTWRWPMGLSVNPYYIDEQMGLGRLHWVYAFSIAVNSLPQT